MNIYLILELFILALLVSYAYAGYRAAPWVPTDKADLAGFLGLANFQPGQKFADLGAGDGRLVKVAAEHGAFATGFEISFFSYFLSLFKLRKTPNARIVLCDFWNRSWSEFDVVYGFLMPRVYGHVVKKFSEMKPGAKLIVYAWPLPDLVPTKVVERPGHLSLYLYIRS